MGNSAPEFLLTLLYPVHPHMRGEQFFRGLQKTFKNGSSPHAWGTDLREPRCRSPSRFIPTCVGNSISSDDAIRSYPVHPHMRGEQITGRWMNSVMSGSSPHAWGTDCLDRSGPLRIRFIPTCVGNSANIDSGFSSLAVHPHMRGEQWIQVLLDLFDNGSSPHAWGTDFPCLGESLN